MLDFNLAYKINILASILIYTNDGINGGEKRQVCAEKFQIICVVCLPSRRWHTTPGFLNMCCVERTGWKGGGREGHMLAPAR